jgi:hypothetical protein
MTSGQSTFVSSDCQMVALNYQAGRLSYETVPDLAAAARMLDLAEAPEADVRQALGSGFPKHPLHKIVCIGALIASRLRLRPNPEAQP